MIHLDHTFFFASSSINQVQISQLGHKKNRVCDSILFALDGNSSFTFASKKNVSMIPLIHMAGILITNFNNLQ